jgi:hypothetical protein
MTSQILGEVDGGRFGNAFAYCCVMIIIVLTALGVIRLVVGDGTFRKSGKSRKTSLLAKLRNGVQGSTPSALPGSASVLSQSQGS